MHLLIPHASSVDEAARHALSTLQLPNLTASLARLQATAQWGGDEASPEAPHEWALAALWGQALPTPAAWLAGDARQAWALMTPLHLAVGTDGVDVLPPSTLRLTDSESQALHAALAELWPASEGWQWRWLTATRWLAGHPSALDDLSAPSLDRVAGRPIEPWLPPSRLLRRWQNEAQMLLHGHPVNQAREARGELVVNSVWISGMGRATGSAPEVQVDERLRTPLQEGDLAAWAEAWAELDAGPLATLRQRLDRGEPAGLTLSGERWARRFDPAPRSLAERLRGLLRPAPRASTVLEAL